MKTEEHTKLWRRLARKFDRLATARGVTRVSRQALAACALLADEAADQYAALSGDGGGRE